MEKIIFVNYFLNIGIYLSNKIIIIILFYLQQLIIELSYMNNKNYNILYNMHLIEYYIYILSYLDLFLDIKLIN